MNETLKNAQKILFENLKIAKIEHVTIQNLINQIERARMNLDLTDDVSIAIDQMQTEKIFDFASIDLIKKSNTTTTSYNETISKNFQQLKKIMKQKMTKLIIERLNNRSNQSRSEKRVNYSKNLLIKSTTAIWNSKKISHFSRRIQAVKKSQSSEKFHTSVEKVSTSISSSLISST
jgi:hypothetical protein